jgi:2-polyprenyl-3-methyl-5-hydroxy-6-metoxy-1,4-benzoquinol methylase
MDKDYIRINKALWNKKTDFHVQSDFYDLQTFIGGKSSLNDIELALLGDLKGKSILHLQCHFGQDSISLARMGARVVGVDFSDAAINKATELATHLGADASFICTDVYSLGEHLTEQFDIVFTSYGTIGWLPDMKRWAEVVARFTRPGGQFVFVDFHPIVWMFDNSFSRFEYSYFNRGPIIETLSGTYADKSAEIAQEEIGWNHNLAEVMQQLTDAGMNINSFAELDYSPYNCFANTLEVAPGKYQIAGMEGKIPMLYSLKAVKL